jgi:murein DD-endopeptidase MepM/ murein hydrolase activator NlpD
MFIEKRRSSKKYLFLFIILAISSGAFYLYNSTMFEQNRPIIEMEKLIYWNLKKPIVIRIYDDVGIKNYRAFLDDGKNRVVLLNQTLDKPMQDLQIEIEPPKLGMFFDQNNINIIVEVTDSSKWNFLSGNSTSFKSKVVIDKDIPLLMIINNSYSITKGGTATVVFKANDDNLDELYINTTFNKRFYPQKFYKDGYYISMLAWPVNEDNFSATIVAKDKAGNSTKSKVRFYLIDKKYKTSKINLKDSFLDGKISELFEEINPSSQINSKIEKFKFINEKVRASNEELIHKITSKVFLDEKITNFDIKPFFPLKNAAAVATFGDHRLFYYDNQLISQSYHVGLDLASVERADILSSNLARVAYAEPNGIYGRMPILYHGLGLYSLYGHCAEIHIELNDIIKSGTIIAKTGKTGLALGDHLHFGILVQGVEVRPAEWMDGNWIKLNVINIIEEAKKIIDKR